MCVCCVNDVVQVVQQWLSYTWKAENLVASQSMRLFVLEISVL